MNTACETSLYKKLCVSTLQADPSYKGAKLSDLAKIALKAATVNATALQKQISTMEMQDSHTDLKKSLADCKENYKSAVSQLNKCKEALESNRYSDVNAWVTAAMSDIESCGDGFEDEGLKASPILNMNTILSQLCSNVLAIVNKLSSSGSSESASPSTPTSKSASSSTSAPTSASSSTSRSASQSVSAGPSIKTIPTNGGASLDGAKTALKAATEYGVALQKEISGMLKSESDTNLKASLKDCNKNYQNAVSQLKNSEDALESKRYNDVNAWVSAAMSDAESCADGFQDQDVKSSPIASKNTNFRQLCSNVLAITNKLDAS